MSRAHCRDRVGSRRFHRVDTRCYPSTMDDNRCCLPDDIPDVYCRSNVDAYSSRDAMVSSSTLVSIPSSNSNSGPIPSSNSSLVPIPSSNSSSDPSPMRTMGTKDTMDLYNMDNNHSPKPMATCC